MKSLQKMKESAVSIARMVHQRLGAPDSFHPHAELHASDLTSQSREFCPREFYLMNVLDVHREGSYLATAMRMTFDTGIDVQSRLNNRYLRDVMWGNWRCPHCKRVWIGEYAPDLCDQCGHKNPEYVEMVVRSDEHDLVGSLDGVVDVGMPEKRMLEVKTIDKDAFKKLTAPQPEHLIRTNLYMQLIARDKVARAAKISSKVGHLLYVSKSYGFKNDEYTAGMDGEVFSPFKEFVIKNDPDVTKELLNRAKCLKHAIDKHEVPARICGKVTDKRAKVCPVHQQCFGGQVPQQVTWKNGDGQASHPAVKLVVE